MSIPIDEAQKDPLRLVKKSYWRAFLMSTAQVVFGLLIAFAINNFFSLDEFTIRILQASSLIPGSTAVLGARGRDIETWGGKSQPEWLNQKLFFWLSSFGLFFPVIAFSLTSN